MCIYNKSIIVCFYVMIICFVIYADYSPSDAIIYANGWCAPGMFDNDGNIDQCTPFRNYDTEGGDCANFVSQCLYYGNLPVNGVQSDCYMLPWAPDLESFLQGDTWDFYEYAHRISTDPLPANLAPGDVIMWHGTYTHATIVSSVNGSNAYVDAHTNNHCGATYSGYFYSFDYCNIYHFGQGIGVNDNVTITSGPTSFNDPAANGTYTSIFHANGTPPATVSYWDWKIAFYYAGGQYIAQSISNLYGYNASTWNFSGFTLPTGYLWDYDQNGYITGYVQTGAWDSDNYYHTDTKNITYSRNPLFPNDVIFTNQTISNTQPDVKAHDCIDINTVTIQSGGLISFKAGNCINIDQNLTVNSGGNMTLQIDPSLRY